MISGLADKQELLKKSPARIQWAASYDTAIKLAEETRRPLFLLCRKRQDSASDVYEHRLGEDERLVNLLNDSFILLRLIAEDHEPLFQAMRLERYPSIVFATADRKIVKYHSAARTADEVRAEAEQVLISIRK